LTGSVWAAMGPRGACLGRGTPTVAPGALGWSHKGQNSLAQVEATGARSFERSFETPSGMDATCEDLRAQISMTATSPPAPLQSMPPLRPSTESTLCTEPSNEPSMTDAVSAEPNRTTGPLSALPLRCDCPESRSPSVRSPSKPASFSRSLSRSSLSGQSAEGCAAAAAVGVCVPESAGVERSGVAKSSIGDRMPSRACNSPL